VFRLSRSPALPFRFSSSIKLSTHPCHQPPRHQPLRPPSPARRQRFLPCRRLSSPLALPTRTASTALSTISFTRPSTPSTSLSRMVGQPSHRFWRGELWLQSEKLSQSCLESSKSFLSSSLSLSPFPLLSRSKFALLTSLVRSRQREWHYGLHALL
jgi:hypothetical protein